MPRYGVTWRCSRENCDALLATQTLSGAWHIWKNGYADRVVILEKGEVQVACPACGLLNEWQWAWSPKEEAMPRRGGVDDAKGEPDQSRGERRDRHG